jgi:Flp pilus assembly protein TadG
MKTAFRLSRRVAARVQDERAQAAIELLLIFPTFLLVVLLVVELGLWMYESVTVSNAVREAARYAAVNCAPDPAPCDESAIQARAVTKSNSILSTTDVAVSWVDRGDGVTKKGSSVVVNANHSYSFLFFPGITVPVASCADMRMEQENPDAVSGSGCP